MSVISSTAVMLCTCTIACVIIKMLLPDGKTRKTMNLIITTFLIIVMISPMINLFKKSDSINISTPDESVIMRDYDEKVLAITQENIRKSVIATLEQNNIEILNVFVKIKSSKPGGIIIDYISIYITENTRPQTSEIIKLTEENFGVTPEIILE